MADLGKLFIRYFNQTATKVHNTARAKGWWDEREKLIKLAHAVDPTLGKYAESAVAGCQLALIHSEVSESLEGIRGDLPDDKVPEFSMEEVELADAIIRIMDYGKGRNLRVAESLIAKLDFNDTREYKHGGKTV